MPFYNSCSLKQALGDHHLLTIKCLKNVVLSFCENNGNEIEDLIGSVITLETKSFASVDYYGTLKFKGVITGLKFREGLYSGEGDFVIIEAKSPTIIADDGPDYSSFSDMSFQDIIKQSFRDYDSSKLSLNTKHSKQKSPLIYTVQYNESTFQFAKRLAARYGEWMYYDGEQLVFGLGDKTDEIELKLGRDLQDLNISLSPTPQHFEYFTNDYLTNNVHEQLTTSSDGAQQGNLGILNKSSKDLYTNQSKVWANLPDDDNAKNRLDESVKNQQSALQLQQYKVSGICDNPGVALSSVVVINDKSYRVVKVTHSFSNNGDRYENSFEGVSNDLNIYPNTNIDCFPVAQLQTAKVIDNHDPQGLGRVKVQMRWQYKNGLSTPWIRNLSVSASQGQGFYFIPEIDDEVLVDFEGGNAECPFVVGSVYNSDSKPPSASSNSSNHIKMIQSRNGGIFKINDQDGSITIQDKSGSSIVLDGSGNINIQAAKSINLTAGEDINASSGQHTTLSTGQNFTVNVDNNTTITTSSKLNVSSGRNTQINDGVKIEITAPSIGVKGDAGLKIEGATVDIDGKAITNVKGGIINLN